MEEWAPPEAEADPAEARATTPADTVPEAVFPEDGAVPAVEVAVTDAEDEWVTPDDGADPAVEAPVVPDRAECAPPDEGAAPAVEVAV